MIELNMDGIVNPLHNYSGLSYGNLASVENRQQPSNPRQAALQGLEKMLFLYRLGIPQAFMPPHERPHLPTARALGFCGSDKEILRQLASHNKDLLFALSSSAAMWAANAATISPSCDTDDSKIHITPANLINKFHRSIEPPATQRILEWIFSTPEIIHHPPLPLQELFSDEGAANHTRFSSADGKRGFHLFVYGRGAELQQGPQKYPARQTKEASEAIARTHQLSPKKLLFAQQNPEAIDAGVFHNDVIAVGHKQVFLYHEKAFVETERTIALLKECYEEVCSEHFIPIKVSSDEASLSDVVNSYLFNSQLVTSMSGEMLLIAPTECCVIPAVKRIIDRIVSDKSNPIDQVHFVDVRESMLNGGGPACLRLRVPLSTGELQRINPHCLFTDKHYQQLKEWIQRYYRDYLHPNDLADPFLLDETREALDALTKILHLGAFYEFQQV